MVLSTLPQGFAVRLRGLCFDVLLRRLGTPNCAAAGWPYGTQGGQGGAQGALTAGGPSGGALTGGDIGGGTGGGAAPTYTRTIPVDFIEREDCYVLRADIPGVHKVLCSRLLPSWWCLARAVVRLGGVAQVLCRLYHMAVPACRARSG